jgi:hypothetical protein
MWGDQRQLERWAAVRGFSFNIQFQPLQSAAALDRDGKITTLGYRWRLVAGLAAVESPVRKDMTSSVVMDSACRSPNASWNREKMNS